MRIQESETTTQTGSGLTHLQTDQTDQTAETKMITDETVSVLDYHKIRPKQGEGD